MKFQKYSIFFIFVFFLLTMSCNKEEGSITLNTLRKIDKITGSDGSFSNYTYDNQGRRIRLDTENRYVIYTYTGNTVVETAIYNNPNIISPPATYTLNAQGLATTRKYSSGGNIYTIDYDYDSTGRRLKNTSKTTSNGNTLVTYITTYIYDSDGDVKTLEHKDFTFPSNSYTAIYTFDKSHYNTGGNEFAGFEWLGKILFHEIKNIKYSDGYENIYDNTIYDDKGYTISQTRTYKTPTSTTTTTTYNYTYK